LKPVINVRLRHPASSNLVFCGEHRRGKSLLRARWSSYFPRSGRESTQLIELNFFVKVSNSKTK
jgi:hypothetical protein